MTFAIHIILPIGVLVLGVNDLARIKPKTVKGCKIGIDNGSNLGRCCLRQPNRLKGRMISLINLTVGIALTLNPQTNANQSLN